MTTPPHKRRPTSPQCPKADGSATRSSATIVPAAEFNRNTLSSPLNKFVTITSIMSNRKKPLTRPATQVLFDRIYRGKPQRIAELKRTREELTLGRKIRALREARGLSQAGVAKALHTKAPAISRIENADYDGHSLRILRKIADYFAQNLVVSFEPKRPRPAAIKQLERELVHS